MAYPAHLARAGTDPPAQRLTGFGIDPHVLEISVRMPVPPMGDHAGLAAHVT